LDSIRHSDLVIRHSLVIRISSFVSSNMTPLFLAIFLFAIAAALVIAEMLLPAHGALGVLGVAAMAAGIMVCYRISHALGLYVAVGLAVAAPFVGALWMRLWPRTPLGRRLILGSLPSRTEAQRAERVAVGETGVVVAELRPNGLCDFGGQRLEARAERGVLPAGQRVRVIAVVDGRPMVRPV
jgi:membrane-bound ClpP family serine protease